MVKISHSLIFTLFLGQFCWSQSLASIAIPQFSDRYSVEGIISLPYAEIKEPFIAYFDGPTNKSRVDYYGDLVQTIQRADLDKSVGGINYKLAFMVNREGDPQRVCFRVNGTKDSPVTSQSVLPDLSQFSKKGTDICSDSSEKSSDVCERWEYSVTYGDKSNKYVFWLKRDSHSNPIPVQFLMKGFDFLLGSHYDKYEVHYKNYKLNAVDPKVFEVPKNLTCRSFPGPGVEQIGIHNPIKEFINSVDTHIDHEFNKFVDKHNKNYDNKTHETLRKNIFRQNLRYILSKNRETLHFRLGVNHLADMTDDEITTMRGKLYSGVVHNGGQDFDITQYRVKDIPVQWDWRLNGAVTPVKDQAVCGSCWSFGTTGTIEGVYFVKTGHLVRLSQQQLIDCSWNEGDNGCDGGEDFRAYEYILKSNGISTEDDYGSYIGSDGKCHDKTVKKSVRLDGFVNVTNNDAQALEAAIFFEGPVTVAIDASHKSLSFYSSGVYYEPKCKNGPKDLDHQVLAVGFGVMNNQKYWLIKNSWSTYWGNDGYFLISQKDNNCGVATQPTFPIIANS